MNDYQLPTITTPDAKTTDFGYYQLPGKERAYTFQNQISLSCYDEFSTTDSLQKYCNSQDWKKKDLFYNLINVTHISKFGNPNNHFINDWIAIDTFNINNIQNSIWDTNLIKCYIPAVFNIDIMYATFGSTNNTQISIVRAQKRIEFL